jgi:hypothetical protein
MDAYVFARIADRAFLNRLLELAAVGESPIRYAAVLTGDADAIAAAEVDGFEALDGLLDTYFRPDPPLLLSTAIGLCPPPPLECKMPRKKLCAHPVEAFVRIWVEPGRADTVVADLLALDGIEEAGAVAGDFDVLTVLCEPTLGDARSRLVDQVHRVPSIVRTSTSFVLRSEPAPAQG